MSQVVNLEVFYPYPPERVWQVLTDRRALANWMMENDFEPKLGHKFRFCSQPLPGLTTTIQCEVVELEEPTRLVYTWRESPTAPSSLVIWTLTTVSGGTQLRLKHHQCSYTTAIAASKHSIADQIERKTKRFLPENYPVSLGADVNSRRSSLCGQTRFHTFEATAREFAALEVTVPQTVAWKDLLNQKLPIVLAQGNVLEQDNVTPVKQCRSRFDHRSGDSRLLNRRLH
jgi:uncharacterized protein YndB with AHSA1/START domain